jgi:hypothetical protein
MLRFKRCECSLSLTKVLRITATSEQHVTFFCSAKLYKRLFQKAGAFDETEKAVVYRIVSLNVIFVWSRVQQKVSGYFRSVVEAHAFCRFRGYLSTLRKQRMPVLTDLEQALVGLPVSPAF